MPKQNPSAGERSKVRLLFVDGEFAPGEIQAIAMAFARPSLPAHQLPPKQITSGTNGNGVLDPDREVEVPFEEDATIEEDGASASTAAPKSSRGKRTYPTPPTVEMDMEGGGKSFKDFAREKAPKNNNADRYLVAAVWCSEYANLPSITTGHVRTCYIAAGWTYKVQDPLQPLRYLRDEGLGSLTDGNFAVGHLGIARVQEMNAGSQPNA